MSNLALADLKLGGRLSAFADAYLAEHYARASSIAVDIGEACSIKSLQGLPEAITGAPTPEDDWSVTKPAKAAPEPPATSANQSCVRGAHDYAPVDERGWRVCKQCGFTNVSPPQEV